SFADPKTRSTPQNPARLADVAPTVLSIMGLPLPAEMTGQILVRHTDVHCWLFMSFQMAVDYFSVH
ncbi:MAG: hypothetical protein FJX22_02675, partial [Alphaproteobacteria bacterium]|nr:hypothetical protein [Alphaproteobacteria bacterium]